MGWHPKTKKGALIYLRHFVGRRNDFFYFFGISFQKKMSCLVPSWLRVVLFFCQHFPHRSGRMPLNPFPRWRFLCRQATHPAAEKCLSALKRAVADKQAWTRRFLALVCQKAWGKYGWCFRNPANSPVEVGKCIPLQGLYIPGGFLPSTLVILHMFMALVYSRLSWMIN